MCYSRKHIGALAALGVAAQKNLKQEVRVKPRKPGLTIS